MQVQVVEGFWLAAKQMNGGGWHVVDGDGMVMDGPYASEADAEAAAELVAEPSKCWQ